MKTYIIKKTSGLSSEQIYNIVSQGGRFVMYGYCISILALTLRRVSSPYFIKSGERLSKYRLRYNIFSLLFGWWGLPWGPIYTIDMIKINLKNGGGVDITEDILMKIKQKYGDSNIGEIHTEDIAIDYDEKELIR